MNKPPSEELIGDFEKADVESVRELARAHTREAVNTLVKLMKATKTPPGVKRACASDILSQGWGRPDARGDGQGQQGGLTINIMKLSTGVVEQITSRTDSRDEVIEATAIAHQIAEKASE